MPKVCLITGASRGIGRFLAESLLERNFLVAGCSRGESSLCRDGYLHCAVDVTEEKGVVSMVRHVEKKWGGIDVLINNAGVAGMGPMSLIPEPAARKIFLTNFLGTFLFTREAGKGMIRKKRGRIVNFTSVAVPFHLEGEAIYASSKSAIEEFTRISARELGPFGITVNALGPGPVQTDLIRGVAEDKIRGVISRQAIRRMGEMRDILNVVQFFISDQSDFITGQCLYLGGA